MLCVFSDYGGMKLEINISRTVKMCKHTKTDQHISAWTAVTEDIKRENIEEKNEGILENTGKIILREHFVAICAYIKKLERLQINNLTMNPEVLRKQDHNKLKISRKNKRNDKYQRKRY